MTRYFVDRNVQPEQPPPNRYPVPVGERIGLPEPLMLDAPVVDVIRHRRTARDFLGTSISLSEVATLLGAAFAPRFPAESPTLYTTQTYSRGAPFVVFALFAGGGVPQALRRDHAAYQYNPEGNQLVFRGSASIGAWSELLWRQDYANGAPMLLVICADWQQYMWKYRTARAYRWALMECGAFMHTTLLAATALGLRTFQTPAIDDDAVCELLGVDDAEVGPSTSPPSADRRQRATISDGPWAADQALNHGPRVGL